jgi:GGDEF domain-containing protein
MAIGHESVELDGERRQVTVLFADLVGFTAFSERAGEEAAYALMQRVARLMTGVVEEQGGTVRNFTGDGIMALFGVPNALEDASLRACRAALVIHDRLANAAGEIAAKYGIRPQLRIGINTGPVVVAKVPSGHSSTVTALGDTVNLASRLQALAKPEGLPLLSTAFGIWYLDWGRPADVRPQPRFHNSFSADKLITAAEPVGSPGDVLIDFSKSKNLEMIIVRPVRERSDLSPAKSSRNG